MGKPLTGINTKPLANILFDGLESLESTLNLGEELPAPKPTTSLSSILNDIKTKAQDFATVHFDYGIKSSGLTTSDQIDGEKVYKDQKDRLKDICKTDKADLI